MPTQAEVNAYLNGEKPTIRSPDEHNTGDKKLIDAVKWACEAIDLDEVWVIMVDSYYPSPIIERVGDTCYFLFPTALTTQLTDLEHRATAVHELSHLKHDAALFGIDLHHSQVLSYQEIRNQSELYADSLAAQHVSPEAMTSALEKTLLHGYPVFCSIAEQFGMDIPPEGSPNEVKLNFVLAVDEKFNAAHKQQTQRIAEGITPITEIRPTITNAERLLVLANLKDTAADITTHHTR